MTITGLIVVIIVSFIYMLIGACILSTCVKSDIDNIKKEEVIDDFYKRSSFAIGFAYITVILFWPVLLSLASLKK